ncbi:hypothetical protein B0H14DRAFT_2600152 [Mycena olivaceomarginata]|nr:hypothetical protein B0H14DRAFT_2600152 [Mycena olivaceomarginata]
MHRCWTISELVAMICLQLALEINIPPPPGGYHPRPRCTCQDSQNFPGFCPGPVVESTGDLCQYTKDVTRPILPADWERPLFYLHRVRSLHLFVTEDLPSRKLFEVLTLCRPEAPLFPNVQRLSWMHSEASLFPYLHALLGQQIADLEISLPPAELSVAPIMAIVCPQLVNLNIIFDPLTPSILRPHLRTAGSLFTLQLTHIVRLRVEDLHESAFEHLATLPSLKSLMIDDLETFTAFQRTGTTMFPVLQHLHIGTCFIENARGLIRTLITSPLVHLSVLVTDPVTAADISELYTDIARFCRISTMRRLEIDVDDRVEAVTVSPGVKKLFCLHHLQVLSIYDRCGWDLDDEIVFDMARALPSLRHLHLYHAGATGRVTLASLGALADRCKHLASLNLEVNALSIPTTPGSCQMQLKTWNVGSGAILDPRAVADFVYHFFPAMSRIISSSDGEEINADFPGRWQDVEALLTAKRHTHPPELVQ